MKKEELDQLRAKYLQGETSLEEERLLKEHADDAFFGGLKEPSGKMDWDFDAFMEATTVEKGAKDARVVNLPKRIIMIANIAASLLIGFLIFRPKEDAMQPIDQKQIAEHRKADNTKVNAETLQQVQPETVEVAEPKREELVVASVPKSKRRPQSSPERAVKMEMDKSSTGIEEGLYVEVNGVRIYDEQKALEITETALSLATSNLKRGVAGLEKIKHLNIEI
ncbi:hypothetical protein [Sphingobacterium sp. UBA6645]|uniref:hypothetical protein n=1 Tax=Sphingobacterium sp. UBA6645 TaxID=1947511 RepID=UPI0025EB9C6C|nr:hypothetical protein [Sphingobacterium sp. UBA6645]